MKKIIFFISLILISVSAKSQYTDTKASSVTTNNSIGLEPNTQKIRTSKGYDIALSRTLDGGSRFYFYDQNSTNAVMVDSYDFAPNQEFIVFDFELLNDTVYFCGSYFDGSANKGFIARASFDDLFFANMFNYNIVNIVDKVEKLKVFYNTNTPTGVKVSAIGDYSNIFKYIDFSIPNPLVTGNESYIGYDLSITPQTEIYNDLTVTDHYVAVVGYNSSFVLYGYYTQKLLVRTFEKFNSMNNTGIMYDLTTNLNMQKSNDFRTVSLRRDNIAVGNVFNNINVGSANNGLIVYNIDLNNLLNIYTPSLTGTNQNIFWLKEMIYDANQNKIYAMVSENKVFNLDISFYPPFPYSSLEVEIQSGLYLPNVNMTGIMQYSPTFFKLVGMNNSDELHLFEKVIPYKPGSPCNIVTNGIVDSFEEHTYFITPPAMNHVTDSPSPRVCIFKAQYQGNIYIDCIY